MPHLTVWEKIDMMIGSVLHLRVDLLSNEVNAFHAKPELILKQC